MYLQASEQCEEAFWVNISRFCDAALFFGSWILPSRLLSVIKCSRENLCRSTEKNETCLHVKPSNKKIDRAGRELWSSSEQDSTGLLVPGGGPRLTPTKARVKWTRHFDETSGTLQAGIGRRSSDHWGLARVVPVRRRSWENDQLAHVPCDGHTV